MIRLVLLPLAYAVYWVIRTLRTPWCQLIDHATILDPVSGLMCARCGHVIRTPEQ